MRRPKLIAIAALLVTLSTSGALAQHSQQQEIDQILKEVIHAAIEAAREEVKRNTGVDPLERGYDPEKSYRPAPKGASEEVRRELRQLNEEHDRKIAKLYEELDRKLGKAEAEFEREAAREDKAEKIREKRKKLREKVDEAYAKFEEKIGEENARYDEKRSKILSKS